MLISKWMLRKQRNFFFCNYSKKYRNGEKDRWWYRVEEYVRFGKKKIVSGLWGNHSEWKENINVKRKDQQNEIHLQCLPMFSSVKILPIF